MVEAKHEFVDDYPYLVYTSQDTLVYSDKADTSIDDIGGGGDEYSIKCAEFNSGTDEFTEIESIAYYGVYDGEGGYEPDTTKGVLTTAKAGEVIVLFTGEDYPQIAIVVASLDMSDPDNEQFVKSFDAPLSHCPMPAHDCYFVTLVE